MNRHSIIDELALAALTARQGGGGKKEALALVVVVAATTAERGSMLDRIKAALLMGSWRRRYANNG